MLRQTVNKELLSAIREDPALGVSEIAGFLERQPAFQNTRYPFALNPLLISASAVEGVRARVEAYVRLLEKAVLLYREEREVRDFFKLGDTAERLIDAEGLPPRAIWICRLDGYLTAEEQSLRILENNADSPAGTLFTPRLNRSTRALLASHLRDVRPVLPMDEGDPFPEALLTAYRESGGEEERPFVAILQPRGRGNRESEEVAASFQAQGISAAVVDPRDAVPGDGGLAVSGRRLSLIWNKINTVYWNGLVAEAPHVVERWAEALRSRAVVHVNSFGARYVAEAKTSLALLHEPRFQDRFTPEERALIGGLVPWTRRLERGVEVEFEGERQELVPLLLKRQADFVVKQQYDIRGDGVTIGRGTPPDQWRKIVEESCGTGSVAQRYIRPATYEVALAREGRPVEAMKVSLDSFLFGGRLVGFGAKASVNDRVNLFQGGSKLSVIVSHA